MSPPNSDNPFRAPGPEFAPKPQPHRIRDPNPAVLKWQMVYVSLMALLLIAAAIGALVCFVFADELTGRGREAEPELFRFMGVMYCVMALFFATVYSVGLFWKRGSGAWVFHIVLISPGITQCCTWPATIPLLIYWIKHRDDIIG